MSFAADENMFFIRDTGLISRTLAGMGLESKCIMPLPYHEEDVREWIVRTEYENLESAGWWKSLEIDALVLYSWGAPRYRRIAKAVHEAGIRLWIHMDTSGNFEGIDWPELSWYGKITRFLKVKAQDYFRAKHLKYADIISMGEPAAGRINRRLFYRGWFRDKCYMMPCPVSPVCRYESHPKKDVVLCIGRWDDKFQKRPEYLMQTLQTLYALGCSAETRIIGRITDSLQSWHATLPSDVAKRIVLVGFLTNKELLVEYKRAKIVLCTSSYESSHIVSAEGLCSGCAVVTPNRPKPLCNLLWYTTRCSGTIAADDTPSGLASGILSELKAWERGERDPLAIAEAWQPFFHADKVIEQIFSK